MPDLYMDVDAALSEVPVNLLPLLDATDFKTIEDAVAYNAAGMALRWHFVTTAGAYTVTSVTPTTGGNYDWTDQGDSGIYTIEIPASGGASINNDTEGFGWFTGVATGVLPWRGPVIGFRAAALNNSLIDGTTIDVNVTAMAAGVVTAAAIATGAIDADAIAADAITDAKVASDVTIASVTGAVGSVTGAVGSVTGNVGGNVTGSVTGSVGSVASGGITAASIATNAIDADALAADAVTEIQAGLSTLDAAGVRTAVGLASANLDTQLAAIDDAVDTEVAAILAAVDTEVAAIKAKTDNLPAAPAAVGDIPTAAAVADAVWDEAIAGHVGAGSTGEALGAAGSAGDPWTTALPGAYGSGQAGKILGDNLNATVSSRATQTSVDTVDDLLDTEVAAIKTVVDAIEVDTQDIQGRIPAALVSGRIDSSVGAMASGVVTAAAVATGAIDADALAADAIDEILDELIGDSTITMRQALKLCVAALGGKLSGAATTTVTIRNAADDANRIVATVDADGNRSAVTLSL